MFNCSVLYKNGYSGQRIMLAVCSDKFDVNGKLVCPFQVATSFSGLYTQLGVAAIVTGVNNTITNLMPTLNTAPQRYSCRVKIEACLK